MTNIEVGDLSSLASVCDTILGGDPAPTRVAVPYLHVLSAHPNSTYRYADLFSGRSPLWAVFRNKLVGAAIAARAAVEPPGLFFGDPLPASIDVLFVSHFLRPEQAAGASDLYFGDAPERLSASGVSSAVALINHVRAPRSSIMKQWRSGAVPRMVLSRTGGLEREIRWAHELGREAAAMRAEGGVGEFAQRVPMHAAADAISSGSRFSFRIGAQVGMLVERLRPRLLVTTYEGHAWERLAYCRAREALPGINCVGYHHTVLFPFPHAMSRRIGRRYDPDRILTAGAVTRDWLITRPGLDGVPIEILGSVRVPEGDGDPATAAVSNTCLVLPEGVMSESIRLADAAAACAAVLPKVQFRIRLHPLLTAEAMRRAHPPLRSAPSNLEWSSGVSLEQDLADARWVLYRGTTAVIPAIVSGLKPIYWGGNEELSIDPLAQLLAWRERASGAEDVVRIVAADLAARPEDRRAAFAIATEFCRKYFMPFDVEVLRRLVAASGR